MLYVRVPPPPVAKIGANGVISDPIAKVTVGVSTTTTIGGGACTDSMNVLLPVADAESVTVTI